MTFPEAAWLERMAVLARNTEVILRHNKLHTPTEVNELLARQREIIAERILKPVTFAANPMLDECITAHIRSGFHGLCVTAMAAQVVAGVDFPDDWYIDYKKMDWADFAEQYLHPGFESLIANFEAMIEKEVRRMIEPAMDSFFKDVDKSLGGPLPGQQKEEP